tara:strand:- start:195 stop:476 length:282 start_codon:yes stop_codon:yes gene_type:complete
MKELTMKSLGITGKYDFVLFGDDGYLRMKYADQNHAVWLIGSAEAFTMVGAKLASTLEVHYVAMSQKPMSDEELEDAKCEQMASDDYEASVYA